MATTPGGSNAYAFLSEGGEIGRLIRNTNWKETSIGSPNKWSESIRNAVRVMLDVPYAMCVAVGNDYIQIHNDSYTELLQSIGLTPAIGIGIQKTFGRIGPDVLSNLTRASGGEVATTIESLKLNSGTTVLDTRYNFTFIPVKDNRGHVDGIVITAYRQAADDMVQMSSGEFQALKASEERFRTMAQSTSIMIALSDTSSNATFFNNAWSEFTGRPIEDLLKFGWADLIHPEDREGFVNHYLDSFKKRSAWGIQNAE